MKWIRKLLLVLVLIFALFYLVTRPEDAATAVRTVAVAVGDAFQAIIIFFTSLAK